MKDPGCMCSPMPYQMKMQMSYLLNFILEEKPLGAAKREPSFVVGIGPCLTFISGYTCVRQTIPFSSNLSNTISQTTGLTYDAMKDQYKVYADGEKVESGSWSDSPFVRFGYKEIILKNHHCLQLIEANGIAILGQDQDNFGGGFDR